MLLCLFGSTGRVGGRVLEYALAEGHSVRALVRNPAKLAPHERLDAQVGDVLNPADVARVVPGTDAIISGLGGAGIETPGEAQSQGMRNIVAAMEQHGIRRVLGVAGSGILDSAKGGLRHDQPYFVAMFKEVSLRHLQAWEALRASTLDWTLACCPDIVPGERTGAYHTRDDLLPEGARRISVENVADFLLRELVANAHRRRRVGLGE